MLYCHGFLYIQNVYKYGKVYAPVILLGSLQKRRHKGDDYDDKYNVAQFENDRTLSRHVHQYWEQDHRDSACIEVPG
jgi:hypothetical protein